MNYKDILKHRSNRTSQYGEEGIIDHLLELFGDDISKTCCEVGAGNGMTFSNSYHLWKKRGWKALLIEGASDRFSQLIEECRGIDGAHPVNKLISSKGKTSIETIARDEGLSLDGGLLVVDIDSFDSHVFENMGAMKPAIVIIEYNNNIPPWVDYQDPEGEVFLRHSLKALTRIGTSIGYDLAVCTITNGIFIRQDLAKKHGIEAAIPEEAYLYEEQAKNKSIWGTAISCQLVTSFPIFLKPPRQIDRLYFRFRAILGAFMGGDPYRKPSQASQERLAKAGLYL